jgi:hypothetical protein
MNGIILNLGYGFWKLNAFATPNPWKFCENSLLQPRLVREWATFSSKITIFAENDLNA